MTENIIPLSSKSLSKRLGYGICLVFLSLCSKSMFALQVVADEAVHEPLIVFLVRHAEKLDASRDPELTPQGKQRAKELANTLRSAKLTHVHSTDFIRTRDTAAPAAAVHQLQVELYDPNDLPSLVTKLRQSGGRHLIVGHSTTTPSLVKLLGGDAQAEINEAGEFDRLYVLTVGGKTQTVAVLLRYGQPFQE